MSHVHVFLVCDPKPGSIFVSSTLFLWIWRAGVTHLPQEHCSPHQLKEPSLALHLGQRSWNKAYVSWRSFAFLQKNYPWQLRIEKRNTAPTFKNLIYSVTWNRMAISCTRWWTTASKKHAVPWQVAEEQRDPGTTGERAAWAKKQKVSWMWPMCGLLNRSTPDFKPKSCQASHVLSLINSIYVRPQSPI